MALPFRVTVQVCDVARVVRLGGFPASAQAEPVERPRNRDADCLIAGAAEILDRGVEAGCEHPQSGAHYLASSCPCLARASAQFRGTCDMDCQAGSGNDDKEAVKGSLATR